MRTTQQQPSALDQATLNAFIGKAVVDWGTPTSAVLVVIGDVFAQALDVHAIRRIT